MGKQFVVDTMVKVLDAFGWMKSNVTISTVVLDPFGCMKSNVAIATVIFLCVVTMD